MFLVLTTLGGVLFLFPFYRQWNYSTDLLGELSKISVAASASEPKLSALNHTTVRPVSRGMEWLRCSEQVLWEQRGVAAWEVGGHQDSAELWKPREESTSGAIRKGAGMQTLELGL